MRLTNVLPLLFLLFGTGTPAARAAEKLYSVKIRLPQDVASRQQLLSRLEVDHYQEEQGYFRYVLGEAQYELLKKSAAEHQLISADVLADYKSQNDIYYRSGKLPFSTERVAIEQTDQVLNNIIKTPAAFQVKPTLGGYYSFAEMESAMNALVAAYPSIAQKFSIGTSVEGRPIWCVKISDNVSTDETGEPELLYTGLVHAREAISGSSLIFFMQYLCENYVAGNPVKNLVDNRECFIIPCANPDGWEYNRSTNPNGGGQWRKNRRDNGDGSYGVDLNRNWNADWANCNGAIGSANCGSASGTSDVYWGSAPFSEPETFYLKQFIESRQFAACLDQHAVGPYYSLPFGRLTRTLSPLQNAVYTQLTSGMGKYNGMRYGNTYQTLGYEVSGAMKDWLLLGGDNGSIASTYSMTAEGGNGTSVLAFWPLASDIISLCRGMVYQNLQLAYSAGAYVDFQDIGSLNLSSRNGNFSFRIRRTGLADQPVTVSIIPLNNITSVGSAVTVPSLPNFNDSYTGSISYSLPSNLGNGGNVRFAWRIETGGQVFYDTVRNFYNATVLTTDNMESGSVGTKWTITGGGWNYSTEAAYNGSRSLTESPSVNYANNATLTAQYKSTLDLRNTGLALLSFYVKHRAENFRDKLQLQVSVNGKTWVVVPGKTTVKEPGTSDGSTLNGNASLTGISEYWTREVFDLKNFLGNRSLRFRLQFTSNGSSQYVYGTDAGFHIDDLVVLKGVAAPAQLVITGNNQAQANRLSWNTEQTDALTASTFTVERSANGIDYLPIGTVPGGSVTGQYTFDDAAPYAGENYYRVLVQGESSYRTNPVVLNNQAGMRPTGIERLYPNPNNGLLHVEFQVSEPDHNFVYRIINQAGQLVQEQKIRLTEGLNLMDIDATGLPAGNYILSIVRTGTGLSYEQPFIRL